MDKSNQNAAFNTPEFLRKLKNGDRAAFRQLVEHFQARVYNLALKVLWNREDAEDVLQETFLKVIDKIGTFREESDIGTWIYRIAMNAALMKLRERQRQRGLLTEIDDLENQEVHPSKLSPEAPNPFDNLLKKESREILQTAIEGLPDIYRVVFVLKDVENLSTDEIAEILGLSHEAIYSRLKRARMRLREAVLAAYKEKHGEGSYALS